MIEANRIASTGLMIDNFPNTEFDPYIAEKGVDFCPSKQDIENWYLCVELKPSAMNQYNDKQLVALEDLQGYPLVTTVQINWTNHTDMHINPSLEITQYDGSTFSMLMGVLGPQESGTEYIDGIRCEWHVDYACVLYTRSCEYCDFTSPNYNIEIANRMYNNEQSVIIFRNTWLDSVTGKPILELAGQFY